MKRYQVRRGSDSAPNWSESAVLSDFSFPWEQREVPKTEFRALRGEDRLHFRFDCRDDDLVLPDGPKVKDRVLGSDRVEIFFAPDLSLNPYFCLEMSPRGDALAYEARFYRQVNWDWQCAGLELAAQIVDDCYSVIGSVPLARLRELKVLRGCEMYAGIYRAEFHRKADGTIHQGWMPWVDPQTEKPDFHVPASFGVLEFE